MSSSEQADYDKRPEVPNITRVVVRLKGQDGLYDQEVLCNDGEDGASIRCGVECDGGGFNLKPGVAGVALNFEDRSGLALNSSCGEPDDSGHDHWLTGEEAGVSMTLAPQPAEACLADDRAAKPAFVKDETPLRARIGPGKWTCLSRRYDKAHLAKHPKQKVTSIALAIEDAPKVITDEYEMRSTVFDADLSVRLRDGKTATRGVQCTADEYQFRCGGAFRLRRNDDASAMLLLGEFGGEGTEVPTAVNDLKIGSDDLVFRLNGSSAGTCAAE